METLFDVVECKVILAIAEEGSFSAAAKRLHYTQSGITHMMCRLENMLGFKLWLRCKGGVRLSDEGEALFPVIRRFLDCYDELEKQAAGYCR